jgi:AAA family ATP:ADP antiporter
MDSNTASQPSMLKKAINTIWPVENHELKKFLPIAFIMFCVLFNYSGLRVLKDALVVSSIGAEAISFLKTYFVMPCAVIFTVLYMKLLNRFGDIKIFYIISGFFTAFFVLFAFVLYPNQDFFHPDPARIKQLAHELPRVKWFIMIYGKWIYATLYIIAELWGSIMLSLLFWQFANKVTTTSEAKRFYSMFGLIGNVSLLASGEAIIRLSGSVNSNAAVVQVILLVIVACVASVMIYAWVNRYVLTDIRYYNPLETKSAKAKKAKLSVKESIQLIFASKYLGFIALLVLGYGITINLVEVPWKSKIHELYPTTSQYLTFTGKFNQYMAISAWICMIIGSNVLRLVSWRIAASVTPIVIVITGLGFFVFSSFQKELDILSQSLFGVSALVIAVFLGMMQNLLSKGIKYSLFDSTKEMAYIPLDNELKTKGKAAVDVIGGRLGKAGGSFIISMLFTILPSANFNTISTALMTIFVIVIILWLYAIKGLSKEYNASIAKK